MPKEKLFHSETRIQVPVKDCVLALIREDVGEGAIGRAIGDILYQKYSRRLNQPKQKKGARHAR